MFTDIKLKAPYSNWLNRVAPLFRALDKIPRQRWLLIVQLLLVVVLTKQLASFTWQLIPVADTAPQWQANPSRSFATQQTTPYSNLANLYLFGQPPVAEKAEPVPEQVPVSRLAAKISGIVSSSNPARSLAIIKLNGSDKTYRISETLKGTRAKVHEIYPDRVILMNGDRFESLLMFPNEANKSRKPIARPQPGSVKNAIAQIRSNPASLTNMINIQPETPNGELLGYRITPVRNPELFRQLGLKSGDLITEINGHDLTNQAEAMKIFGSLKELKHISLTVEREGQQYQVDISS